MATEGIDLVALANPDTSRSRRKPSDYWALRHIATRLWFRADKTGLYDSTEYRTHPDLPTLKTRATMVQFRNRFAHPDDWEMVRFVVVPAEQVELV